jgi:hypothetical protein
VDYGADLHTKIDFVCCNFGEYTYKPLSGMDALGFALELARNLKSGSSSSNPMLMKPLLAVIVFFAA